MKPFAICVLLASPIMVGGQVAQPDAFVIVRGAQYEGAIVPASSGWHKLVWAHPAIRHERTAVEAWTPTAEQVAAAERAIEGLIERASREANAATSPSASSPRVERGDLRSLAVSIPKSKRQYVGIVSGSERLILIHGFPDVPAEQWQTQAVMILGGACTQFWLDFNVTEQRITATRCAGID